MQEIIENIYAVSGQSVGRIYIIAGKDSLTLVDTSLSTQTADKLEKQLQGHGYQLDDIHNILLTHAHPDHIGGLAGIQARVNARTYIHRRDAPFVRGEQAIPGPRTEDMRGFNRLVGMFTKTMPMPAPARVDTEVKEGDTLDEILPGLQVIELHGHSPGQVGYWWPEKRLLFGGDVLMNLWGLTLPLSFVSPDMDEAKRSVRKMADLAPDILCLGHGSPLVGDAAGRVKDFIAKKGL